MTATLTASDTAFLPLPEKITIPVQQGMVRKIYLRTALSMQRTTFERQLQNISQVNPEFKGKLEAAHWSHFLPLSMVRIFLEHQFGERAEIARVSCGLKEIVIEFI
jgi:hypothetical protein